MPLDRDTLLVFGAFIPSLLGLVAIGVAGGLRERDRALWLWGMAMLVAGLNQLLLISLPTTGLTIALANACFLTWVVLVLVSVGWGSGRQPRIRLFAAWAAAAWLAFLAAAHLAGDLRLGRLLNWPNIVLMFCIAFYWAASDRRKRMPLARGLLLAGLGLEALAVAFRTSLVAFGDLRAVLLMDTPSTANVAFLAAATLGLILGTLGMLLSTMDAVNRRLRFALEVDALTRLASRHAFFEQARAIPEGTVLALLMVDIDHFKAINDRFGHAGGDAALAHAGQIFRTALPAGRLAARLGGEEFAVLLPGAGMEEALALAETLRATAAARPWRADDGEPVPVQFSIGVASGREGLEALLRRADAALYRAKAEGRNRVVAG
ncbi:MAG: hypothetical protein KatS3mg128_1072 [Silanimonas sp.]|nr:MAG: hypothetical protein KatS3mg127_1820 [Silanimonas sp.]GIX39568.1 MAG: hypothetical protein KatS3mg128_0617 [Silanimonas sp.]GIX40023.1 MAG: hypothetical protein KatS3mg128_1072 [Silanimonas sp.]